MSPKGARSPRQRSRIRYASAASDALRGNRACRRRGPGAGDLAFPLDHLLGQGVEQDPAQVTAEHPGRLLVPSSGSSSSTVPCWSSMRVAWAPWWMIARNSPVRPAASSASCPLCSWMSSWPPCVRALEQRSSHVKMVRMAARMQRGGAAGPRERRRAAAGARSPRASAVQLRVLLAGIRTVR
jgi:hypothetical protein